MRQAIPLLQKYGNLSVIKVKGGIGNIIECRCVCGKVISKRKGDLVRGSVKNCGIFCARRLGNKSENTKACIQCKKVFNLANFTKNKVYLDGLDRECKKCQRVRHLKKYVKNTGWNNLTFKINEWRAFATIDQLEKLKNIVSEELSKRQ